jgi:hypothetical protein
MTRIPTKGIFPLNYELVKHLRPPPPKWASVCCGRQNTRALSGRTARQEASLLYTSPFIDPIHLVWMLKKTQQLGQ